MESNFFAGFPNRYFWAGMLTLWLVALRPKPFFRTLGGAMVRWRWGLFLVGWTVGPSQGWWHPVEEEDDHRPNGTCWAEPFVCHQQKVNATMASAQLQYTSLTTWDSII